MRSRKRVHQRGSSIVEFALVAVQLMLVLLSLLELSRMVLVTTAVANAARTGIRYGIVHGATRSGAGADGPSGPGQTTQIENNIRYYAGAGLVNTSRLSITVNYPDGNNAPGSRIRITIGYPYDPFTVLPLGVNLGSTSEGVISF